MGSARADPTGTDPTGTDPTGVDPTGIDPTGAGLEPSGRDPLPVLVYDGDCGFCAASARWLERKIGQTGRIASAQGLGRTGLADLGLTAEDAARAAWWIDADGRAWRGHLAVAQALRVCPAPFGCLGELVVRPPLSWLGAGVYRLVVRWRHLLPGATDACRT